MSQKIRIKLKSYDYSLVDKSAEKIVKTVKATGAIVSGPIPLPTHKRIFTVNRSTFVNKKSRETVRSLSIVGAGDLRGSDTSTRGPCRTYHWFTGCPARGTAGYLSTDRISAESI